MPTQATLGNARKKTAKKASKKKSSHSGTATRTNSNVRGTKKKTGKGKRAAAAAGRGARAAINYGSTAKKAAPKMFSAAAIIGATMGSLSLIQGYMAMKQQGSDANKRTLSQMLFAAGTGIAALIVAPKAPQVATGLALTAALSAGTLLFGKMKVDGKSPVSEALQAKTKVLTGQSVGTGMVKIRRSDGSVVYVKRGTAKKNGVNGTQITMGQRLARGTLSGTQVTMGQRLARGTLNGTRAAVGQRTRRMRRA